MSLWAGRDVMAGLENLLDWVELLRPWRFGGRVFDGASELFADREFLRKNVGMQVDVFLVAFKALLSL